MTTLLRTAFVTGLLLAATLGSGYSDSGNRDPGSEPIPASTCEWSAWECDDDGVWFEFTTVGCTDDCGMPTQSQASNACNNYCVGPCGLTHSWAVCN